MPKRAIKTIDEGLYPYAIIDSIIYFSTINGDGRLPTNVQAVYREICDAVVEHISRQKSTYQPLGGEQELEGKTYWTPDAQLEKHMWAYLQKNLRKYGHKLLPRVRISIEEMLDPRWHVDEMRSGEYQYLFKRHFDQDIAGVITRPTNLQLGTKEWVEREVLPALTARERREVQGIGKLMGKYILLDELCW